jgi:hypothetical protein
MRFQYQLPLCFGINSFISLVQLGMIHRQFNPVHMLTTSFRGDIVFFWIWNTMSLLHNNINLSIPPLSQYWKLPVKASITRSKHSLTQIHKPTIQLTQIYVISLQIFLSHYNSSKPKPVVVVGCNLVRVTTFFHTILVLLRSLKFPLWLRG